MTLNQYSDDVSVLINRNSGVVNVPPRPAEAFALHPVAPNPVVTRAYLIFELPRAAHVVLAIYDAAGRLVRTLEHGTMAAGPHRTAWDGRGDDGAPIAAGVYVVRLVAGGETPTRRLVLVR